MRRDKERVDWHLILALAVAVLCCLLQDYSTFSFTPAFRIPIPIAAWENRRHPEPHERPPLPIITDLDGDNKTEILSVLPDGRLQLWSMQGERPQVGADDEWPQPRLVKEVLLESKADVGRLGRPIAMVTGKLWANRTGFESQQQVIVVDDGGAVKCYDAKLRLVWESHLHGDRAKHIEHHTREAAVAITALPLRVGDVGAVIVGRRFQVTNKRVRRNPGRVFGRIDLPEPESPHDHDVDEAAHFSYYAFEGQTGALRWRHEAGDFYQVMEHERPVHEALADSKLRHLGEVEWTLYSEDLVASFPHHWYHRGDTHFALRHFERRTSIGSTAPSPASASASVAPSAAEEHALRERMHAEKPNVVVAFREKGLEAVHLYSGRTLCELHVPPRELHADINGDMILEQMIVHREGPSCWLAATAGIPPVSPLWNVSVCGLHLFAGDKEEQGVAPLLAVPTPPHAGSELLTYATAVLVESGRVTLVDPEGRIVWSTQTEAKWKTKLHTLMWQQLVASRLPFGHSSVLPPDYGTVPASPGLYRFPMAADTSPVDEHVLAVAWGLALLDRKTGEQLATASMPTPPTGEAVVGDFNGDGVNDVIIPTAAGFYAFVLERSLGFALYPLAVAGLVCTLGVQYLLRHRHAAATTTKRKAPPLLKSSHVL